MGLPGPVGANVKRERATRGQPVALPVYARRFGAAVQRQRTVLTLNIPFRERWQHLAALFARVGVEVEEGSAGQTGLFAHPYALFSVTWRALAPGCRFA